MPDKTIVGVDGARMQHMGGGDILTAIKQLNVIDPAKIQCVEFRVLLRVMESSRISEGGILKPSSAIEKEMFGKETATIVNIGALAFTDAAGTPFPDRPKPGDVVITAKYAGITMRDKEYNLFRFCNDKDVVAIVKE